MAYLPPSSLAVRLNYYCLSFPQSSDGTNSKSEALCLPSLEVLTARQPAEQAKGWRCEEGPRLRLFEEELLLVSHQRENRSTKRLRNLPNDRKDSCWVWSLGDAIPAAATTTLYGLLGLLWGRSFLLFLCVKDARQAVRN